MATPRVPPRASRLVVSGTAGRYEIEPARFEHCLSRVEMVDHYLRGLPNASSHRDVDKLLDARLRYMAQEAA